MAVCENCGNYIADDQDICFCCGCRVQGVKDGARYVTTKTIAEEIFDIIALIGFIFSFFGLIPGVILCGIGMKSNSPRRKKMARAGISISIVVTIIVFSIPILAIIFR